MNTEYTELNLLNYKAKLYSIYIPVLLFTLWTTAFIDARVVLEHKSSFDIKI